MSSDCWLKRRAVVALVFCPLGRVPRPFQGEVRTISVPRTVPSSTIIARKGVPIVCDCADALVCARAIAEDLKGNCQARVSRRTA